MLRSVGGCRSHTVVVCKANAVELRHSLRSQICQQLALVGLWTEARVLIESGVLPLGNDHIRVLWLALLVELRAVAALYAVVGPHDLHDAVR